MDKKNINKDNEDKVSNPNESNLNENTEKGDEKKLVAPEEKIKELEDKVTRAFAEMENQRRRYEKEKDDYKFQ